MKKLRYVVGLMVLFTAVLMLGKSVEASAADGAKTAKTAKAATTAKAAIDDVEIKKITTTAAGNPKITWKAASGATTYRIYRRLEGALNYVPIADTRRLTFTDKTWDGYEGSKISYKIRPFRGSEPENYIYGELSASEDWIIPETRDAAVVELQGYMSEGYTDARYSDVWSDYYHYSIWYEDRVFNVGYPIDYSKCVVECVDNNGVSRYVQDIPHDRMINWALMEQRELDITSVFLYTSPDFLNITFIGYDYDNNLKFRKVYATKDLPGYPNPAEYDGDLIDLYLSVGVIYGKYAELLYVYPDESTEFCCYLDLDNGALHKAGTFELPEVTLFNDDHHLLPGADSNLWACVDYSGAFGVYFSWTKDETEWCYLDCDYSVLASFADATIFTADGYALVSNDHETYYMIDRNLRIIPEFTLPGMAAAALSFDSHMINILSTDGYYYAVRVTVK